MNECSERKRFGWVGGCVGGVESNIHSRPIHLVVVVVVVVVELLLQLP